MARYLEGQGLMRSRKIEEIDRNEVKIEIKAEPVGLSQQCGRFPWLVQVCNLYPRTEENNRMVELMNNRV